MSYALLSEVWGPDEVEPEQEQTKTPQVEETPKPEPTPTTETKETFVPAPIPTSPTFIQDKKDSLPLFLSILVVGSCAIYAIDMFASKLSN